MAMIRVLTYNELATIWPKPLPTCTEKGYPEICEENLSYWVMFEGEDTMGINWDDPPLPIAYTCSKDMGDWIFIGNTYVLEEYRGQNIHRLIVSYRNSLLDGRTKVTVINPYGAVEMSKLERLVASMGYEKITKFSDVLDIMDETTYWQMECPGTNLWRMG
jgi:hypothetical protein